MDPTIVPLPRPASAQAPPSVLLRGLAEVADEVDLDLYGHQDFTEGPQARVVTLYGSASEEARAWVALAPGVTPATAHPRDVWGFAEATLPLREDTHTAIVWVGVRPAARSQGIGRALWAAVATRIGAEGRTTWQTWTHHADRHAIATATVNEDSPAVRWLRAEGFTVGQVERLSTLTLGPRTARRRDLTARRFRATRDAGPDYQILRWEGMTPARYRPDLARLYQSMSTDAPNAEMDREEQVWDSERVRETDSRTLAKGHRMVTAAVRHVPRDVLVGYTCLEWPLDRPAGVWQGDTLVRSDHRGRHLGTLLKASNLLALWEANSRAERVHTWNAAENTSALALNTRLGFRPAGIEGAWQRRDRSED